MNKKEENVNKERHEKTTIRKKRLNPILNLKFLDKKKSKIEEITRHTDYRK